MDQNGFKAQAWPYSKPIVRSFMQVSYVGAGVTALGPSSSAFPDALGAELKVEQLGFQQAPIWGANGCLTCYARKLAPFLN